MNEINYYHNMIQYSEEWWKARLGILTASNMGILVTPVKQQISKSNSVTGFAYELAAQRETQHVEETYQSWDMERGHIEEDLARTIYSKNYEEVIECGFITREFDDFILGISPDGLVGVDGGIEIKCRKQKFQVQTIISGEVPNEHILQIQTSLLVTERKWWDYVQYSNGMPMFVKRVLPDLDLHKKIIEAGSKFEKTVKLIQENYQYKSKNLVVADRVDHMHGDEITPSGGGND